MKVTLWISAVERPPWPCVMSWLGVDWPCEHTVIRSGANNIRYSWNEAVRRFLASDSDWLWSCHNDIIFKPGTLKRLLSWDKPLVGAMVFMHAGPALPHIWEGTVSGQPGYKDRIIETIDWFMNKHPEAIGWDPHIMEPRPDDALRRVSFSSTSCLLIHRKVLEAMQDPWFLWDDDYTGGGEDRRFFENALAAGYEGYVDRSCIAGHLGGDHPSGVIDFTWWTTLMAKEIAAEREDNIITQEVSP